MTLVDPVLPVGDGEDKCVRNPWGIISGTLRH